MTAIVFLQFLCIMTSLTALLDIKGAFLSSRHIFRNIDAVAWWWSALISKLDPRGYSIYYIVNKHRCICNGDSYDLSHFFRINAWCMTGNIFLSQDRRQRLPLDDNNLYNRIAGPDHQKIVASISWIVSNLLYDSEDMKKKTWLRHFVREKLWTNNLYFVRRLWLGGTAF